MQDMTPEDVQARIAAIDTADDEQAHWEQDMLWRDVLSAIRDGAPEATELAGEALKVWDLEFSRWYA